MQPEPELFPMTVWYSYTPSARGVVEFFVDADGASINMEVFTGSELAGLEGPIESYFGDNPTIPMTLEVDAPLQTYWIRVYYEVPGEEGPFELSWEFDPGPEFDPVFGASNTPVSQANTLGCSQHVAYIQSKCNGPRLCELTDISSLGYDRRLDDISEAFVEIPIDGDADNPCCSCLADVEPWCHLLTIVREGDGVVWTGPVQRVVYGYDTVRIEARDKLAWLQMRINEIPIIYNDPPNTTIPLTTIAKVICETAMIDDDDSPCFLDPFGCVLDLGDGLPPVYPRNVNRPAFEGPTAYDDLIHLSESRIDFTVVSHCLILTGEELPPQAIGILTDEMILGDVHVIKDGTKMANRVYTRYESDTDCSGSGGCSAQALAAGKPPCLFPYIECCPCPVMVEDTGARGCFGLLERLIPNEFGLDEVNVARETGQSYLDANKMPARFIEFPTGTRLSPETPWLLSAMIPGQRIDVALTKLCLPVFQSFKLLQVAVSDGPDGEQVSIDLKALDADTGV